MSNPWIAECRNVLAIGRNYVKHIEELNNEIPEVPVVFGKSVSSLTDASALMFPRGLAPIHFELEVVLRIGVDIEPGTFRGLDQVSHAGLGIDFTARERQSQLKAKGLPWQLAKSFQHAAYLGPLREQPDLTENIAFQLFQNEALRQHGETRLMMFDFVTLLGFINRTLPLRAGDLVYTGTPAGVGPVAEGDRLRLTCSQLNTDCRLTVGFFDTEST